MQIRGTTRCSWLARRPIYTHKSLVGQNVTSDLGIPLSLITILVHLRSTSTLFNWAVRIAFRSGITKNPCILLTLEILAIRITPATAFLAALELTRRFCKCDVKLKLYFVYVGCACGYVVTDTPWRNCLHKAAFLIAHRIPFTTALIVRLQWSELTVVRHVGKYSL